MECANGAGAGAGACAGGDRSKVNDFSKQILQLAGIAFHQDEEKSRTEVLEKLKGCNKRMLVELCRSFDIPGSTSTKKDELVTMLMEFLMEHGSGIIYTDPDKVQVLSCQKLKKRKSYRSGANLSSAEPSKKRKPNGTVLETRVEEEADGRKAVEDRTNYSEFCLRDNRDEFTNNKTGIFAKEQAKPEPFEGVNDSSSGKLAVVPFPGVPIPINEQKIITTPSAKLVCDVENDTMDMVASMKKNISVTKKKMTQNIDSKEKIGGKIVSRGDAKPRKQALKPSKDELRQAVFCILGAANFATMTFGEVVKAVDKYFGKDLFERKPLVRALIEEELFRLAKEAEKKELEEEAKEAKARAEQSAKDSAIDGRVESDIDKEYELQDGKSKDAEKSGNNNSTEKGAKSGVSWEADENRNRNAAAENLQDGEAEVDTRNKNNSDGFTKDFEAENIVQNANDDAGIENLRDGKAETANNCNGNIIGGSEDVKSGENDDTKDGRTEDTRNKNNSDGFTKDCEAENSVQNANGDAGIENLRDGKAETANNCNGNTIGGSEDVKSGENDDPKDGRTEATRNKNNSDGFTKDCEVENIVQNANGDAGIENFRDGKAETVNNCNGDAIGGSQDVKSGENNDTTDGRTEERWAENDAETVVDHGPEESKTNENVEHVNSPEAEDVKSEEARGNEITLSRGTNCGKTNEIIDNAITEAKRTDANDDGKAEDSEHSINTKIDAGSSDHGTCENGKTMDDAETKTTAKPKIQMC